jgi:hypothetical protein
MYTNKVTENQELLRRYLGVTAELLQANRKPFRRSRGWVCPTCSFKSRRHYNMQRHIDRQHSDSAYAAPLDAVTLDTRDEKYRKHFAKRKMKGQDISNPLTDGRFAHNGTHSKAFIPSVLDPAGNILAWWPSFYFKNSHFSNGLKIMYAIEQLFGYPALIHQQGSNSFWFPTAGLVTNYQEKLREVAANMISPLQPTSVFPQSINLHQFLIQHHMNSDRWNYNQLPLSSTDRMDYPQLAQLGTQPVNDQLILGYQVRPCNRCLTTDYFTIEFQYNTGPCMSDPTDLSQRESFLYPESHVCDLGYYGDAISGISTQEMESYKKCVKKEKDSGQFLFKAISNGPWIEKPKFLVAIRIPPIVSPDKRVYMSIISQMPLGITNNGNANQAEYQQNPSDPTPISARINLQEIPIIEIHNSYASLFHRTIQEGVTKLNNMELTEFCELTKVSSIVVVRVDGGTFGFDNTEKNKHPGNGADTSECFQDTSADGTNDMQSDLADSYVEAALGAEMFLVVLTPNPEIYPTLSVVLY